MYTRGISRILVCSLTCDFSTGCKTVETDFDSRHEQDTFSPTQPVLPKHISNHCQPAISLQEVNRLKREADHSPLSISEVTNAWSCTTTPPT
jgi:hypothetical protein